VLWQHDPNEDSCDFRAAFSMHLFLYAHTSETTVGNPLPAGVDVFSQIVANVKPWSPCWTKRRSTNHPWKCMNHALLTFHHSGEHTVIHRCVCTPEQLPFVDASHLVASAVLDNSRLPTTLVDPPQKDFMIAVK
jgi:hypothetical protein